MNELSSLPYSVDKNGGGTVSFDDTLPSLLRSCVSWFADQDLLVFDGERITFAETERQSARLARRLLADGIGKGSRVGLIFPNSPAFIVSWFAIVRIGAVAVTISTLATETELKRIIEHADLSMLLAADAYLSHDYTSRIEGALGLAGQTSPLLCKDAPFLRRIKIHGGNPPAWADRLDLDNEVVEVPASLLDAVEAHVCPADPCCIIYTSGTTSEPKGVIHSQGAFTRQSRKLGMMMALDPMDRHTTLSPLFWVGGLVTGLLAGMVNGAAFLSTSAKGGALLDFLEAERITHIVVWPHMAKSLTADPSFTQRDWSSLRDGRLAEALPVERRRKHHLFAYALGMTESCGPHTAYMPDLAAIPAGTMGPSSPGMQHRIVDIQTRAECPAGEKGELEIRGDTLMLGYVGKERSDTFSRDGWFRTGDLCAIVDGYVFFHGRVDDMIKSAGANVSPIEVEATLLALEGVEQAHVVGVGGAGSTVVGTAIVLKAGRTLSEDEVRAHTRTLLSSYKVPKLIRFCSEAELPMTATSKVDKRRLAAMLAEPGLRAPSAA